MTPLASALALELGLVDQPDGRRKLHYRSIPLAGGLAVFVATTLSLVLVLLLSLPFRDRLLTDGNGLIGLLVAACIICAVGLADDWVTLRGRHKLFGQLLAVGAVMSSGVVVRNVHLFGFDIWLGPLALPFTAVWLLGAINSLNLIDGMDGLLGCVGTILCLAMATLAVLSGQWVAAAVSCALAGALLAFLCFNFPPASVFMGDSGSMLVGLVIGTVAIQASLKGPATVALAAPTALLTIPIFDTLAAILRRKLTGRSIYTTDRGHIHHSLLRRGISNRRVLLIVSTLCLLTVAGCLLSQALDNEFFAVAGALLVVNILVVGRLFGHAEFLLVKERLLDGVARQLRGGPRDEPRQMEVRLQGSADWAELWSGLVGDVRSLELESVCLDVNAPAVYEGYHARWDRSADEEGQPAVWRMEVPLLAQGQTIGRLEIASRRGNESQRERVASVMLWIEEVEQAVARLALVRGNSETTAGPAEPCPSGPRHQLIYREGRHS